jgi:hypothetical protein
MRPIEEPANEALQQTKPGITTHEPVFAAERRCSTDTCGLRLAWERPRPVGMVPHEAVGPAKLEASLNADGHGATRALVHPVQWRGCNGKGGADHGRASGVREATPSDSRMPTGRFSQRRRSPTALGPRQTDVMERHV